VVNLCLDEFKKRKWHTSHIPGIQENEAQNPVARLETDERINAIQKAVEKLPERQRAAVVLHRFTGLSIKEVAQTTGWSESAVESLLVRAYAKLRKYLKNLA